MKKFYALMTGLFALLALVCVSCEDDPDVVIEPVQGRFVSDVAVPFTMEAYAGMPVTLAGRGFEEGDAIVLHAASEYAAETVELTKSSLTFRVPENLATDTYRLALKRDGRQQTLGSTKLAMKLATGVTVEASISAVWGREVTVAGTHFLAGDRLVIRQGDREIETEVVRVDETSLTFTMPMAADDGEAELVLVRGEAEQVLGKTTLFLSFSADVPDREGANIKGVVYCGKHGVKGVQVSDGVIITTTDENGFFWMNSAKRQGLVFVIQPSGYDVAVVDAIPQFWSYCTADISTVEQHNFRLYESDNDAHTMLVATDMHLANRNSPRDYNQFRDGFAKEIEALYNAASGKVYMLNLGDFAWDQYWYVNKWSFPECKKEIAGFNFPFWSTMGNHDNNPYVPNDFGAEQAYRDNLGPVYYSMNIGKVHYIMLDNTIYINSGASEGVIGSRNYSEQLTQEQLDWLAEDLKHVDKSTPIVVGMHCPMYGCSALSGGKPNTTNSMTGVANFVKCFDGYQSVDFVTGHTHINRNFDVPGYEQTMREHNVAAVCGTWWWTEQYTTENKAKSDGVTYSGSKINVCTDGSPAGYKVFTVNGTDIRWEYKPVGLDANRQFLCYDMNEVKEYWKTGATAQAYFAYAPSRANDYKSIGDNVVVINVWAYGPGWTVKVAEEGRELPVSHIWTRDPLHSVAYDIPRGAVNNGELTFPTKTGGMHMFAVTASSPASTLEITVTDRFGRVYTETMERPKKFTAAF